MAAIVPPAAAVAAPAAAQPIAAAAAGAPQDLPQEYLTHWQDWNGAKNKLCMEMEEGVLVLKPSAKLLITYAPFIRLSVIDGELYAHCVLQGCTTKAATQGVRITFDKKLQMCNSLDHMWRVHGGAFLTTADFNERKSKADSKESANKKRKGGAGADAEGAIVKLSPAAEKSDYIKTVARWLIMDGLAWNLVQGPGFRQFSVEHGLPIVGRTSISDAYKGIYEREVLGPIRACISAWKKVVPISYKSHTFSLRPLLLLAADGWEARNGLHFLSLIVHGSQLYQGKLTREQVLVGLRHWMPKEGAKAAAYTAEEMMEFVRSYLATVGVSIAEDVLGFQADTAAVNIKFSRLLELLFLGCLQHVLDLACEDLMKSNAFKAAHDAYSGMTVFMRHSPKRITVLLATQEKWDVPVPVHQRVVPTRPSETRFSSSFLTARRTMRLLPFYTRIYDNLQQPGQTTFSPEDKAEFTTHYLKLLGMREELTLISNLSEPILKVSAALGSTTHYVVSCQRPLVKLLLDAIQAERPKHPKAECRQILDAFHASLWTRLAPVAWWTIAPPPGFVEPPQGKKEACTERDDVMNAAAVLDPACFPTLLDLGNNMADATNFFYLKLIKPRASIVDPSGNVVPAVAAQAAANKAQATKQKNNIMNEVKPSPFMVDEDWEKDKKRRCALVDLNFAAKVGDAGAAEQALDPLGPLYTMLLEEMNLLGTHHVNARTMRAQWEDQYGQPFEQGNSIQSGNRLAFWGAQKKTMPLLFYVASILLTAPVASTDNERAHSVGGRIVSKTRCSLVGESVDRNTTGYIWLRKRAAAKAEELNAKGYKQEDLEDHPSLVALVFEEEDPQEEVVIVLEENDAGGAGGAGLMGGGGGGGDDGGGAGADAAKGGGANGMGQEEEE
jgi:hypothetical protein